MTQFQGSNYNCNINLGIFPTGKKETQTQPSGTFAYIKAFAPSTPKNRSYNLETQWLRDLIQRPSDLGKMLSSILSPLSGGWRNSFAATLIRIESDYGLWWGTYGTSATKIWIPYLIAREADRI